jgi:N-methylhydantoinase B/oxoprolinase/acetone carboxylase alpha subunit
VTTKEHLTLHDKQIAAIRNLVRDGMRLVIETRKDIRALVASQQRTERNLETLVNTLGRSGNGKHKQ